MYKRNKEGTHYIDLAKTWEKLMVAARIIAATQDKNEKDVLVSFSLLLSSKTSNDSSRHSKRKVFSFGERARLLDNRE